MMRTLRPRVAENSCSGSHVASADLRMSNFSTHGTNERFDLHGTPTSLGPREDRAETAITPSESSCPQEL